MKILSLAVLHTKFLSKNCKSHLFSPFLYDSTGSCELVLETFYQNQKHQV